MITFDEAFEIAQQKIKDEKQEDQIMIGGCLEYEAAYVFCMSTTTDFMIPQCEIAVFKEDGRIGHYDISVPPDDRGVLVYEPDTYYCPILEKRIEIIECYEHKMGCTDSIIGRSYCKYSYDEIKEICRNCCHYYEDRIE